MTTDRLSPEIRRLLEAIYTTLRGDEKAECWTIRRWLDEHDVFNDDIQGAERLVAEACKHSLAHGEPPPTEADDIAPLTDAQVDAFLAELGEKPDDPERRARIRAIFDQKRGT